MSLVGLVPIPSPTQTPTRVSAVRTTDGDATRRFVLSVCSNYVPEILIEIGVGDLLDWIDVIHRQHVTVKVHELDRHFFERALHDRKKRKATLTKRCVVGDCKIANRT
jgi:hypothetical protein